MACMAYTTPAQIVEGSLLVLEGARETMTDIMDVIGGWREKLLDLSKRNRLINCRTGTKTGAVLLDHPEMRTIWARFALDSGTMQFPWKHELLGEEDDEDGTL